MPPDGHSGPSGRRCSASKPFWNPTSELDVTIKLSHPIMLHRKAHANVLYWSWGCFSGKGNNCMQSLYHDLGAVSLQASSASA